MAQLNFNAMDSIEKEIVDNLEESIWNLILEKDKDETIDEDTIKRMVQSLTYFNYHAIHKFILGQKKHGGLITDKDLRKELRQEHTDMFWYIEGEDWKNEINENQCSTQEENECRQERDIT